MQYYCYFSISPLSIDIFDWRVNTEQIKATSKKAWMHNRLVKKNLKLTEY